MHDSASWSSNAAMLGYVLQGLIAIVAVIVLLNVWYWRVSKERKDAGLCTMCGAPASRGMCDECELELMTP